ncbi:MAG: hypothetical protein FJZ97_05560 [Chloroflexi bacterium]|nr:hypothetical protein [Chloroflexota bacterium]
MSKATRKTQRRPSEMAVKAPEMKRPEASSSFGKSEFNPNYIHVVKDLRRIALLAGGLFLALIILSFFLQ